MKVFIISHDDLDGIGSSAIAYQYFKIYRKYEANNFVFYNINYTIMIKDILGRYDIKEDDIILFLDYSFSNNENLEYLINLIEAGSNILWIDHHKTSLDLLANKLQDYLRYSNFRHVIDVSHCATYLVYELFMNELYGRECDHYIPEFIQYINSHDLWLHNKPCTEEFVYGIGACLSTPMTFIKHITGNKYTNIFKPSFTIYDKMVINNIIGNGTAIKKYLESMYTKQVEDKAFEIKINDRIIEKQYSGLALNGTGNSLVFGDKINEYDFVCLFSYYGDKWRYSIYSAKDDVDCSDIAYKLGHFDGLGGGGHKGAAGFVTNTNILDGLHLITIKKHTDTDMAIYLSALKDDDDV